MKNEETEIETTEQVEIEELTPVERARRTAEAYKVGQTDEEIAELEKSVQKSKLQKGSITRTTNKLRALQDVPHTAAGYEQQVIGTDAN